MVSSCDDGPGGKIDIDQGIQLIQHDIDIIGADAGGDDRDPFFPEVAGMRNESAVAASAFDGSKCLLTAPTRSGSPTVITVWASSSGRRSRW